MQQFGITDSSGSVTVTFDRSLKLWEYAEARAQYITMCVMHLIKYYLHALNCSSPQFLVKPS